MHLISALLAVVLGLAANDPVAAEVFEQGEHGLSERVPM